MHLAPNTSVSIDLGVAQSALTVTPSLPAGLSISSAGVLSGTVATPARNVMVNFTTAVHWSILHEVAHLHEPASPHGMVEPWADFAVTAYFKMVHDLEIWETYKGPLMNRSNFVFSLDSYFENNGASGLGEYSGSPGYVLFWLIAEEHGYEAFQEAIVSMGAASQITNWDGRAIHLSQVTNQNMCTLFQAMSLEFSPNAVTACDAYAEWADHPIRNTGSAGAVEK